MSLKIENGILYGSEPDFYGDLVIPDGVKEIASRAFLQNDGIKSVVIPSSVEKIGADAFMNCFNIVKAVIPESTKIGEDAFRHCGSLITNLSIKQWNKKYGKYKLYYARDYIYNYQSGDPFFDSVKEENNRFIKRNLSGLIDIVTEEETVFVNYVVCEILLDIYHVEKLLDRFSGNVEATAILLDYKHNHFSQKYLEKYAAEQTEKELGLRERTVADWRKIFALGSDKHGGYVIRKYLGNDTDVIIPGTIGGRKVTEIGKVAFSAQFEDSNAVIDNIQKIRSVYIPEGVTKICEEAFCGNLGLEEVYIPSSVTSIERHAFASCDRLTSVTIPDGVTHIGHSAFLECVRLTEITLPGSLREIGFSVFADCKSLTKAVISKGITAIPRTLFLRCQKLAEVQLPDGITVLGNNAFSDCEALKHITLPSSVCDITTAFNKCWRLEELIVPEGVKEIAPDAFYNAVELKKITLPDTITKIGKDAFNLSGITSIKIPSGVTAIPENAFGGCGNLLDVEIPASVTYIYPDAFNLTSKNMVISAPCGSYAIEFAKEHGIKFKEI